MRKPYFSVILAVVALLIGIAVGKILPGASDSGTEAAQPAVVRAAVKNDGDIRLESMRQRIAELEKSLAVRLEQVAELKLLMESRELESETAAQAETAEEPRQERTEGRGRRDRGNYAERMAQLRQENPERYEAIQERRQQMRQRMQQMHQDRRVFLDSVDTSNMSEEQLANHNKLLEAIGKMGQLGERMAQGNWRDMTPEERTENFQMVRAVGEQYERERRFILEETGRAYGEDGAQFADYIENVIENTSVMPNSFLRGMGGGRGGQRGGQRGGEPRGR